MTAVITAVVVILIAVGAGYWAANALLPRFGLKPMREQPRAKRRMVWLSMTVGAVIAVFEGRAFSTHNAGLGVAVLIAVFVLPEFVLTRPHPAFAARGRALACRPGWLGPARLGRASLALQWPT